MVVREPKEPAFSARMSELAGDLVAQATIVRHLGYPEAEAAVERLGAKMLALLGRDEIEGRFFSPIPRGGLIVTGILSYVLDLDPNQLPPAPSADRPVVVVDDIALSGKRLAGVLAATDTTDVVVAHVASHPALRSAVEADRRVRACIAAIDLTSPDDTADEGEAEQAHLRWSERAGGGRLWAGRPEVLTFPWTEPDVQIWDMTTDAVEQGWRLVSPERCLKNRAALGPPSLDRAGRDYRFSDSLAFGHFDGAVVACRLDTEQVFRLDAVAGAMWGAIGTLGDLDEAAAYLTHVIDAPVDLLRGDLDRLLSRLVEAGLLERVERS